MRLPRDIVHPHRVQSTQQMNHVQQTSINVQYRTNFRYTVAAQLVHRLKENVLGLVCFILCQNLLHRFLKSHHPDEEIYITPWWIRKFHFPPLKAQKDRKSLSSRQRCTSQMIFDTVNLAWAALMIGMQHSLLMAAMDLQLEVL